MQFVLGQSPDMTKFGRGSQLAKSLAVSWYMFLKTLTGEPKSPTASPSVPHPIPMRCKRKGTDRIQTLSAGLKWCSSLEPMQRVGSQPQKISARMLMLLLSERYLCTVPASCRGMFGNLSVSVEFSCQKWCVLRIDDLTSPHLKGL